jgi:hypothetical protein
MAYKEMALLSCHDRVSPITVNYRKHLVWRPSPGRSRAGPPFQQQLNARGGLVKAGIARVLRDGV